MHEIAGQALDAAILSGAGYADVRAVETRDRSLGTKNGRIGHLSSAESRGVGIRVLVDGCWGFAATDDLTGDGIHAAARLAVEIARASVAARRNEIRLAEEPAHQAAWTSPCRVDPFSVSVDAQLELLFRVDAELRRNPSVTLAEAAMHFERHRQVFASSEGSRIERHLFVRGRGPETLRPAISTANQAWLFRVRGIRIHWSRCGPWRTSSSSTAPAGTWRVALPPAQRRSPTSRDPHQAQRRPRRYSGIPSDLDGGSRAEALAEGFSPPRL